MSPGARFAAALTAQRDAVALAMANLVAGWPKYADDLAADPERFAALEYAGLVDYLIRIGKAADERFCLLYIGEKARQFYNHDDGVTETDALRRRILGGERAVICAALDPADAEAKAFADALFDKFESVLLAQTACVLRVLFVGDCIYTDVIGFLAPRLTESGIRLESSFIVSKSPAEARAAVAARADQRFDAIFYSPYTYAYDLDYAALQTLKGVLRGPGLVRRLLANFGQTATMIDTLGDLFDCPIFVHDVAPVIRHEDAAVDRLRRLAMWPFTALAARLLSHRIAAHVAARRNAGTTTLHLIRERLLLGDGGAIAAGRYIYRSAVQHPAQFGESVAAQYAPLLRALGLLGGRKLVVCDLDNTLWDGVIGERLGVSHHRDRQEILLRLKARGIVLAINSKNDPDNISWDGALLSAADFVSSQINWQPKVLNMRQIAEHLNLKPKDFVFIDDRADERALMTEGFPGLLAFDALDPATWTALSTWADLLPENPNADRTAFYRQRDARQAFLAVEQSESAEAQVALFGSLGLTVDIHEAGETDLKRVTELINRTNQFNMTGARVTPNEIALLHADPASRIIVVSAADKFGTMGTIAALIAVHDGSGVVIPIFVLSCRVFGYGIERAAIEAARELVPPGGAIIGRFRATDANGPCHDVYRLCGFAREDQDWLLRNADASPLDVPEWLSVTRVISPFQQTTEAVVHEPATAE